MTYHAQRLLVAASRGARIQYIPSFGPKTWMETRNISILFADECRIHPDDIACQYGPIATELRKMTVVDYYYYSSPPFGSMSFMFLQDLADAPLLADDDVFSWLCLFASELAADEGM